MPNSTSWSPEQLTALATVALFLATALLAVATIYIAVAATKQLPLLAKQLTALNEQLRIARETETSAATRHIETETLRICILFQIDPVIDAQLRRLWTASKEGTAYSDKTAFRSDDM
jgi:hypothetical protein